MVQLLIERGADVNAIAVEEYKRDVNVGDRVQTVIERASVTPLELTERVGLDDPVAVQGGDVQKRKERYRIRNAVKQEFAEILERHGADATLQE